MKIESKRFGEIDINESEMIVMKGSILGFGHLKRFVMVIHDEKTPLWWMQSLDDPAIAFLVINPFIVMSDYHPSLLKEDTEFLDIKNNKDVVLLSIVTVRSQPFRVTANVRAPILINAATRMASQIVLDNPEYSIQYDVLDHKAHFDTWLSRPCGGTDWLSVNAAAMLIR
jgi:flagellar assembly factor FliW